MRWRESEGLTGAPMMMRLRLSDDADGSSTVDSVLDFKPEAGLDLGDYPVF